MIFNVLVPQRIAQEGIDLLKEAGAQIIVPEGHSEEVLLNYVSDIDAIIARTEKYSDKIIKKADRLKIIARNGVGTDNVDLSAAKQHGVVVTNTPHSNINAVAELVIAFMFAGVRNLVQVDEAVRNYDFGIRNRFLGYELKNRTLGIIGYGNIGKLVAHKSHFGMGMNIQVYDPYVEKNEVPSYINVADKLEELLANSDIVSIHVPHIPSTHHLINSESFKRMKRNALLINASRGGVVDEKALAVSLENKEILGACIDVFEEEPPRENHPLMGLKNIIMTPHIGAQTKEAYKDMSISIARDILSVMNGETPKNKIDL